MRVSGKTDVGKMRSNNEDAFAIYSEKFGSLENLFIVADGMGGHNAGEIASQTAVDCFLEYVCNTSCEDGEILDFMTEGIIYANRCVFEKACTDESYSGMGTTFSALTIYENKVFIVHLGDSRIYIFGGGKMAQLTNDHTYASEMVRAGHLTADEAQRHPSKNALTRVLGVEKSVSVDARIDKVYEGDKLLICSDGLTNMIPDHEIYKILIEEIDVDEKTDKLVKLALQNGGADNITAVIIEIKG